ncbi:E3 ubiquitin-protein ligase LRSAM1-like [Rhopilema esculentum]|uniref:E3 ubiquitin-protein ligase LRSAM1-like n=1 Tax=Rhopilema esculentum TaxID=499914 RepID=UPI0031DB06D2
MPIFRKSMGKEEKNLFEKKFQVAQEKPDEFFDLTNCGMPTVPDKVYAFCKILQKKIMLLQYNRIHSLNGAKMEEFAMLQVLDLSHNEIGTLPKQINCLVNLQKLDLSFNKLKRLPDEIGSLVKIQTFNLQGNKLTYLPPTIKHMRELQTLDIRENKDLAQLPVNLCYLRSMEEFLYDKERIRYPPREVSSKGFLEIKRWFMLVKGDEFEGELAALQARLPEKQSDHSSSSLSDDGAAYEESIKKREEIREKKKQRQLELEKKILDAQTENAVLMSSAAKERQKLLANVAFEEMRNQSEVHRAYEESEGSRKKLLQALRQDEEYLNDTVSLVLQMTEKARRTEELLDEMEAERERTDMLFRITQEETERLKKEDVIRCMTIVMQELEKHQEKFAEYERSRDNTSKLALRSLQSNQDIETLLHERDEHRTDLLQKISDEEESQMMAFKALQFQKDSKLSRIRQQIDMINNELRRITMLEMEKRVQKEEEEMNRLAEMRINTALILSQLIDEQERRESELIKRLKEMEHYKEDEAKDYWLIQFQRLLDSKPQVLVDDENELDIYVVEILMNANAREYLPIFGRHKITKEQINLMTHDELKKIGVHSEDARVYILAAIKNKILMSHEMEQKQNFSKSVSCEASEVKMEALPSAPPAASLIARFEGECVVCLEEKPDTIFLNCGHVCTCGMCSRPLELCPLCREVIVQKCHLYGV